MLCDEEGQIAAYKITVEARLVDMKREPLLEIDAVANASAGRRRKIAMERHPPLEHLLLVAPSAKT
jgi:hypothetical protein